MKSFRWLGSDPAWKERSAAAIAAALRLLDRTCRIEFEGDPEGMAAMRRDQGVLAAYWHGRLMFMPLLWWNILRRMDMDQDLPAYVLSSPHRDGALIARALHKVGLKLIMGSYRTGGTEALREIRRVLKQGGHVPIAVDGGKGPRQHVQGGVVLMAKLSGSPIIPTTGSCRWGKQLRGWDRLLLPLPGSKVALRVGSPIRVPRNADKDELRRYELLLEKALNALMDSADRQYCRAPTLPAELDYSEKR